MTTSTKPAHGSKEDNIAIHDLFHALKIDPLVWARWYTQEADNRPRPSEMLRKNVKEVIRIIESHNGVHPRVFGSVARGEDKPSSDINIMLDAQACSMIDLGQMRSELQKLLGVPVSLTPSDFMFPQLDSALTKQAIPLEQFS